MINNETDALNGPDGVEMHTGNVAGQGASVDGMDSSDGGATEPTGKREQTEEEAKKELWAARKRNTWRMVKVGLMIGGLGALGIGALVFLFGRGADSVDEGELGSSSLASTPAANTTVDDAPSAANFAGAEGVIKTAEEADSKRIDDENASGQSSLPTPTAKPKSDAFAPVDTSPNSGSTFNPAQAMYGNDSGASSSGSRSSQNQNNESGLQANVDALMGGYMQAPTKWRARREMYRTNMKKVFDNTTALVWSAKLAQPSTGGQQQGGANGQSNGGGYADQINQRLNTQLPGTAGNAAVAVASRNPAVAAGLAAAQFATGDSNAASAPNAAMTFSTVPAEQQSLIRQMASTGMSGQNIEAVMAAIGKPVSAEDVAGVAPQSYLTPEQGGLFGIKREPGNYDCKVRFRTYIVSDEPGPVVGKVFGCALESATVLGNMRVNEESVGLQFTSLTFKGRTVAINAIATDIGTNRVGIADEVDHHTLSRWGWLLAASFAESYIESMRNSRVVFDEGSGREVVSRDAITKARDRAIYAVGNVGRRLLPMAEQNFSRPNSIYVFDGSIANLMFLDTLEI